MTPTAQECLDAVREALPKLVAYDLLGLPVTPEEEAAVTQMFVDLGANGYKTWDDSEFTRFTRVNDEDTSTLVCACGSTFTWAGCDNEGLRPWMRKHLDHNEDTP